MDDYSPHTLNAKIRSLALPTLGSLLIEPTLVAVDSAMIGHISARALAGLSLASTLLTTAVGLCIFLTYSTTAAISRLDAQGRTREALEKGIASIWIGFFTGLVLLVAGLMSASWLIGLFHPEKAVATEAHAYLMASLWGIPAMLIMLAATGVLRGRADTRTPLYISLVGAVVNVPLNALLIYGFHLSCAGAGAGTALSQILMAAIAVRITIRLARANQASLRPHITGMFDSAREGFPLFIRTVCLRVTLLILAGVATALGTHALASHQITMAMWNYAAYGLDSLAIAAQILVGRAAGTGQKSSVVMVVKRCVRQAAKYGVVIGIVIALAAAFIPRLFTPDEQTRSIASACLLVIAVAIPLAAIAYMLDGLLIGAGDAVKLAWYMAASLIVFSPFAGAILIVGARPLWGMVYLWVSYAFAFMGMRTVTILYRMKTSDAWMGISQEKERAGATPPEHSPTQTEE